MKDDKDQKEDLIVEIDESQLALPIKADDDLVVEPAKAEGKTEDVKAETEPKRERKRHNQDAIDALTAQLEAANRRNAEIEQKRLEAEERAAKREAELAAARDRVAQSDYDRVQGYIAAASAKEDALKRDLRSASEIGDHEKIANLQVEIASVAARKIQYQDAKSDMERRAARDKAEQDARPVEKPTERREAADPVEAMLAQVKSEQSRAWLRQHPECVTDPRKQNRVMAAHHEALANGLQPDTREYFEHLEDRMGYSASDDDDGEVEVEADVPRSETRRTMPAAPVSRDTRMGQVAPGKYRLTREEAEMAEAMGMTPTQYAKNKIEMMKSGQWRD